MLMVGPVLSLTHEACYAIKLRASQPAVVPWLPSPSNRGDTLAPAKATRLPEAFLPPPALQHDILHPFLCCAASGAAPAH